MRDLPQIIDYDKEQLAYALANAIKERDEARNKMADALQEVDLRTLDFERMKQERDGLLLELEEYRSIAENIGAVKAVSEKEKAIRERDEARELCRELVDLVAYGLGQSGEPWSADAMRQARETIQKAKALEAK